MDNIGRNNYYFHNFPNINDLFHVIYHFCFSHYRKIFHLLGNNKWIILEEIIITSNFE